MREWAQALEEGYASSSCPPAASLSAATHTTWPRHPTPTSMHGRTPPTRTSSVLPPPCMTAPLAPPPPTQDPPTFTFLLSSLELGLKSLDVAISSSCASVVDNLAGFYFKHVIQVCRLSGRRQPSGVLLQTRHSDV